MILTDLNIRSIRLHDQSWTTAVSIASSPSIVARSAHHGLRHDAVQPVAVVVMEDLHLHAPQSVGVDSVVIDHSPSKDSGVLTNNAEAVGVQLGGGAVAICGGTETSLA